MRITLMFTLLIAPNFCFGQITQKEKLFKYIKDDKSKNVVGIISGHQSWVDSILCNKALLSETCYYPLGYAMLYSSSHIIDYLIERNANVRLGVNRSGLFTGHTVSCLELLVANRDFELIKKYALKLAVDSQTYSSALKKAADLERNDVVIYLLSIGEEVLVKKK
jgi:hypothetical protein